MAITAAMRTTVTQLYAALFNRAPDSDGLGYWCQQLDSGKSAATVAKEMYDTTPARTYYPLWYSNEEIAGQFYTNLLGRTADTEGKAYWAGELATKTLGEVLTNFLTAVVSYTSDPTAAGYDATLDAAALDSQALFNNKVTVGQYFAETLRSNDLTLASSILTSVTKDTATVTTAIDSASAGVAVVTPQTFTLTNGVNAFSGGAGNDVFNAILSDGSGTYTSGDELHGGSGTDTVNLLMASSTAAPMVTMSGVEVVNVRLLDTSGAGSLNGLLWNGVTTVANTSSLADTSLNISGITTTTTLTINDQTDLTVDFTGLTSATDTATLTLVNSGSGSGTTALDAVLIDLDKDNSGLLDAATIALQGTSNYVNLEGGADLRTLTLAGSGNLSLTVTATTLLSTLDASGFAGASKIFVSGRSDVTITGGQGNDAINFGTSLSNADSINGGGGTDSLTATLGTSSVKLNATGVESATISLSAAGGGTLDASAASVPSITVGASLSASGAITNLMDGATVSFNDNDIDAFSIDTVASASLTVNLGTGIGVSGFTITDAMTFTLNSTGASGANTAGVMVFDSDIRTINIAAATGENDLTITDIQAGKATTVTITSNGSAGITLTSGLEAASSLSSLTVTANGGTAAGITLGAIGASAGASTALSTVSLSAVSGADITLSTLNLGPVSTTANGSTTITIVAANESVVGTSAFDITASGVALTFALDAQASGSIGIGNIFNSAGLVGSGGGVTFNDMTVGANGIVDVETIYLGTGQTVSFGTITVGSTAGLFMGQSGILAYASGKNINVGAITLSVTDGSATFGPVGSAATIGNIAVTATEGASAEFGNIAALSAGSIDLTIVGSAATAAITFGTLGTASTVATKIGAITVNASGDSDLVVGTMGANVVSDITVNAAASASANFSTISASGVGTILVSGAGWVDFGIVSAVNVAGIDLRTQATAGTFTIDLSGVTNAVTIDGGKGTNAINSGLGDDVFNLQTGLGTDTIKFYATAQKADQIYRFGVGTGNDTIWLGATALDIVDGAGELVAMVGTTTASVFSNISGTAAASTAIAAGETVIMVTYTAFANATALLADIGSAGQTELTLASGGDQNLVIIWTDGTDSYISLVSGSGAETNIDDDVAGSVDTLATLVGLDLRVTASQLNAANITFTTT